MLVVHGCDPGASAGHCVLVDGAVHWLGSDPPNPDVHVDVLAVEGQFLARTKYTTHKGRRIAVSSKAILTLAFHAGLLAGRGHRRARVLRMAPEVWRALLWADADSLGAEQVVGRLRRDLGQLGNAATDDAVESNGLARAGAVVGLERRGQTPGGLEWKCERQPGWEDVRIVRPRASALAAPRARKRRAAK